MGSRTLSSLVHLLGCPGDNKNARPKTGQGLSLATLKGKPLTSHGSCTMVTAQTSGGRHTHCKRVEFVAGSGTGSSTACRRRNQMSCSGKKPWTVQMEHWDRHVGPPGEDFRLELEMDDREIWNKTKFEAAVCHEIGHLLGLNHTSNSGNLMSTYLAPNILKPTPADIQAVRNAGYGTPLPSQTTTH